MTKAQAQWAASHDWYVGSSSTGGAFTVIVVETYKLPGSDEFVSEQVTFSSISALKGWAGY